MATIAGTIVGVTELLRGYSGVNNAYNVALVHVSFPAYVASTDDYSIAGVGAAIASSSKRGKTNTIKQAITASPGKNSAGTAVYAGALTVSTDALTGSLTSVDLTTEINVPLGTTVPLALLVSYTEA
jgi:hypothetical protein